MDNPKVSVIVTCYNLENYIAEALTSLVNQKCDFDFEIIVVDDGSKDRSVEIIRRVQDKKIRFIPLKENVGASAAINIAWKECRGEYLCRFDGDDIWHPDFLSSAAKVLDENQDIVLVHTDVSFIDSDGNITSQSGNIRRPFLLSEKDYEFEWILRKYYINAPTIMARKSSWDKVLPWPEEFRQGLGDWFCTLSILEDAKSYFINRPLAYYRIHNTNMHRAMIRNGYGEKNTMKILSYFKERSKGKSNLNWNEIYFLQFRHLGFSYFNVSMDNDCRRCLGVALKNNPRALFDSYFVRIYFGSIIGKKRYDSLKKLITLFTRN